MIENAQNLSKSGTCNISSMPVAILMSKISFKKYLPPVRHKGTNCKFKRLRMYWNLLQLIFRVTRIFRISRPWFWRQRLFLLNMYHLIGPSWSQNEECSEFIEIWHNQYFKYANLDFDVKNDFYEIFTTS